MRIIPTNCCGYWRGGYCQTCPMVKAREAAIARVGGNMEPQWMIEALNSADRVMRRRDMFTTDDIWIDLAAHQVPEPHEPRAMGPIMRMLTKAEQCEFSGHYTQSVIPRGHGRTLKIYKVLA